MFSPALGTTLLFAQDPPPSDPSTYHWENAPTETMDRPRRLIDPSQYIDHSVLAKILKKYITKSGWVNYRGILRDKRAREALSSYVRDLSAIDPSTLEDPFDRLAAWLNLYNAMILDEILRHYPIRSMMEIKDFFGDRRYQIGEQKYSINEIEKKIFQERLREPRTVFARVNGASSGPRFLQDAYHPLKIEQQLEDQTWKFLMNRSNVDFDPRRHMLILSPVFLWYEQELLDVMTFLHSYMNLLPQHRSVTYRGYDWELNDEKLH